jgi:DNA-binding MarR family transcriptional regulator
MTTTLTGQTIGQAHYATRAVLEQFLAGSGLPFDRSVVLNLLGQEGPVVAEAVVVSRVTSGLKVDAAAVAVILADLIQRGLLERTSSDGAAHLGLTASGTATFEHLSDGLAGITARLYGGLPEADLAVAGRVLVAVTERANAELDH